MEYYEKQLREVLYILEESLNQECLSTPEDDYFLGVSAGKEDLAKDLIIDIYRRLLAGKEEV